MDDKFIEAFKHIKKIKEENKRKVEKIKNTDLDNTKKVIKNIVNQKLLKKMLADGIVYYEGYELKWVNDNGEQIDLTTAIYNLEGQVTE